jgi:hypothetical protein
MPGKMAVPVAQPQAQPDGGLRAPEPAVPQAQPEGGMKAPALPKENIKGGAGKVVRIDPTRGQA